MPPDRIFRVDLLDDSHEIVWASTLAKAFRMVFDRRKSAGRVFHIRGVTELLRGHDKLAVHIRPGGASTETIRDLFLALSAAYKAMGGSGLEVVKEDSMSESNCFEVEIVQCPICGGNGKLDSTKMADADGRKKFEDCWACGGTGRVRTSDLKRIEE